MKVISQASFPSSIQQEKTNFIASRNKVTYGRIEAQDMGKASCKYWGSGSIVACQDDISNDVQWRVGHQALLEVKGTSGKRELRALLTQNSMSRHGIRISVTFLFPALKRRKVPTHRGSVLLSLGEVSSLPRQT